MRAKLQFVDYHVKEIEYKINPETQSTEIELNPFFDYKIMPETPDLLRAWVSLTFTAGDPQLENPGFYLNVTIMGLFNIEDSNSDEKSIMKYYQINALAILFPYLRALISDITSKGSSRPLILPTINIVKLIKDKETNHQ
ncbi:MAG: protein-export chaperone SecB [Syntrophomonadaceae bacterium]|nr:protein-export chaperone SecB [Syntrophomonadaceae bacterium]MDD4549616.1 protein-export chaperone SecB [Syntrophomonadaceae bacterium]